MHNRLCAAVLCALLLLGLSACNAANAPSIPPSADASTLQSNAPYNHPNQLPSDIPDQIEDAVKPETSGQEPGVSLHLPETPAPVQPDSSPTNELVQPSEEPSLLDPSVNETQFGDQENKILIAYFTWAENMVVEDPTAVDVDATTSASVLAPGHVAQMVAWIQSETGGDLFSIVTAEPYSSDYDECLDRAADEKAANARPALAKSVGSMADYDVIFLGYPDWWSTCPMAVFTFLDSYDFTGKTVIPFCAHGTSGLAASVRDIRAALTGVTVLDAVGVQRPGMDTPLDAARSTVTNWLTGLGY